MSAKGLKQHQKKCQAHINQEAVANERRKATVASKNVRRAKLKERKERLGPLAGAVAAVSFAISNKPRLSLIGIYVIRSLLLEQAQVRIGWKAKTMFPRT